jgi:hypothetical protein
MRSEVRASPEAEHTVWWLLLCRAVEQRVRAALAARGEPVAKVRVHRAGGNAGIAWSAVAVTDGESLPLMPDGALLYAARPALPPGAREAMRMAADALTKIDESRIWPDSVNRNHAAIDALRPWLRDEPQRKGGERG